MEYHNSLKLVKVEENEGKLSEFGDDVWWLSYEQ